MGTLGLIKGTEAPIPSPNTTPNAVTVQRELSELKNEGYEYVAMEMSSHGLAQYRVGGVKVNVAGFTNLTRDHLDYHKTFENYLAAKMILFTELLEEGGAAVLNADIEVYDRLKENCLRCGKRVISYGYNGKDIKLLKATPQTHGQKLNIIYYGKELELDIPLAGEFQAMNILCALGMTAEITGNKDEVVKYVTKSEAPKAVLNWSEPCQTALPYMLTMRIRQMPWRMLSKPCGRTPRANCMWFSAAAATETPENVRLWAS